MANQGTNKVPIEPDWTVPSIFAFSLLVLPQPSASMPAIN